MYSFSILKSVHTCMKETRQRQNLQSHLNFAFFRTSFFDESFAEVHSQVMARFEQLGCFRIGPSWLRNPLQYHAIEFQH